MPYKSEAQRKFMHAQHPEIAKRWDKEYGSTPVARKKKHWRRELFAKKKKTEPKHTEAEKKAILIGTRNHKHRKKLIERGGIRRNDTSK